ncbi:MAG: hypothetical protein KDH96_05825 [Candidatus Riesia sp.]|nr:hypothetical protein [Candidatus Riesia sp.]
MPQRNYKNDYPSVTEVLGVLRKFELELWFKNNTAKFCNEASGKGKRIGTQIHDAIQSYIETGKAAVDTEYHEEVSNALQSFMLFCKHHPDIKMQRAEVALTSEKYGYNGTVDCNAVNILLDWKTGNAKDADAPKVYSEWRYQVAAYYKLWNEIMDNKVNKALIVAVAKDKVAYSIEELFSNQLEEMFEEVFLPALKIANYKRMERRTK